jgi:hypothetical protein
VLARDTAGVPVMVVLARVTGMVMFEVAATGPLKVSIAILWRLALSTVAG